MRQSATTLAITMVLAAILRFWALGSGIPFNVGVDEPEIMNRSVQMMKSGDFNPRFFDYPGFYIHVQAAVACVRFLAGASAGRWQSLDQVDAEDFYLWARAVTALMGTLTVLLVYLIGMRWGARHAALAAGLMAVMPLHVRESHFVLTDVPATFFVCLTLLLSLRANERGRAADFAWAGAAAGLAAATKYPAALALLLPLLSVWMSPGAQPSRIVASIAVLCGSGVAYLAAAPYTILDLPGFLNGYAHLAGYYTGQTPAEPASSTYFKHFYEHGMAGVPARAHRVRVGWRARGARPGQRTLDADDRVSLLYFYFLSGHTLVFGRCTAPAAPVCLRARRGGRRVRRQPAAPLRHPARRAPGGHRRLDDGGAAPAGAAIDRLDSQSRPHQHRRAGLHLDSRQRAEGLFDRHRNAGAADQAWCVKSKNVPQLVMDFRAPQTYEDYVNAGVEYIVASSQKYGDALEKPHALPDIQGVQCILRAEQGAGPISGRLRSIRGRSSESTRLK